MGENSDQERMRLEDRVEMLTYSVEAMDRQSDGYAPGSLEWAYARKIAESCRAELTAVQAALKALPS